MSDQSLEQQADHWRGIALAGEQLGPQACIGLAQALELARIANALESIVDALHVPGELDGRAPGLARILYDAAGSLETIADHHRR